MNILKALERAYRMSRMKQVRMWTGWKSIVRWSKLEVELLRRKKKLKKFRKGTEYQLTFIWEVVKDHTSTNAKNGGQRDHCTRAAWACFPIAARASLSSLFPIFSPNLTSPGFSVCSQTSTVAHVPLCCSHLFTRRSPPSYCLHT